MNKECVLKIMMHGKYSLNLISPNQRKIKTDKKFVKTHHSAARARAHQHSRNYRVGNRRQLNLLSCNKLKMGPQNRAA